MTDAYCEKHERESAEYLRSTKDAVATYERLIADPQTSDAERSSLRRALATVKRGLPSEYQDEQPQAVAVPWPIWIAP